MSKQMPIIYNDGGRAEAGFKGTCGDCVTRSIAIATNRPYREIYDALAAINQTGRKTKGKSPRNGFRTKAPEFKRYMQSLGWVFVATMGIGTGCRVHLSARELPMGALIVSVSKHYTAVIDGVIHDMFDPQRETGRCVYGYWRKSQ